MPQPRESQNPGDVLEIFKYNVTRLLEEQNRTALELSRSAGYTTSNKVASLLDGKRLPNISVAANLARALDVPIGELFEAARVHETELAIEPIHDIGKQAAQLVNAVFKAAHKRMVGMGERPSIDAITAWWQETGGRLENCDQLMPHLDIVSVPEGDQMVPDVRYMGARSLSSHVLQSSASESLQAFLRTLNEADQAELKRCIRSVSYSGTGLVTPQTRIVDLPGMSYPVEISFIRLMLPVVDAKGMPHILNFSTLVSESALNNCSGFKQ